MSLPVLASASPPTPAITITPVPYTGSRTRRLAGDARRQRFAVITMVIAISTRPTASEIASSVATTEWWWSTSSRFEADRSSASPSSRGWANGAASRLTPTVSM